MTLKSLSAMPSFDLTDSVIVFDLDDTLYPEEAYVCSGITAVCSLAAELHGTDHAAELLAEREEGGRDWLTALCALLPRSSGMREGLLWAYRLHQPSIALLPEARRTVDAAIDRAKAVAILTDGRSITQRLKLRALGLTNLPVYISDEYGGADKPDPTRFHALMSDFPAARHIYVADNPAKDFVAPKALGWQTIGVRTDAAGVHRQDGLVPVTHAPDFWIPNIAHLFETER